MQATQKSVTCNYAGVARRHGESVKFDAEHAVYKTKYMTLHVTAGSCEIVVGVCEHRLVAAVACSPLVTN